ncbi:MAG: UDP-N-acetylmuramate dehydrogenase [Bacilli bacterium]|nr:UDP-N-acetylmuramate dehydrogenase [Bacilli bacterium]
MLEKYGELYKNYNLQNHNTYKIKSIAKYFIIINEIAKLKSLITLLKKQKAKYFIIGNGSNIILPTFYNGVVIKLNFNELVIDDNNIEVGSSYMINKLANETVHLGLEGLEWAAGIPGTIGAAIIGNASCYDGSLIPLIAKIEILIDGEYKTITTKDFKYSYRHTSLRDKKVIILKVFLKLKRGKKEELIKIIKDRTQKRIASQPLEFPSAGSVFKNPEKDSAGRLIEEAGLKKYNIGGAEISEKHANFIINKNSATSEDIKKLIKIIKKEVYEKYNVDLILEQEIIN